MWVRASLLDAVRSRLAGQRDLLRRIGQPAIALDRQHGNVPAGVVCDDDEPAARIERRMHAIAPAGFGAVEQREMAGRAIHRKAGRVGLVPVHRTEAALIALQR